MSNYAPLNPAISNAHHSQPQQWRVSAEQWCIQLTRRCTTASGCAGRTDEESVVVDARTRESRNKEPGTQRVAACADMLCVNSLQIIILLRHTTQGGARREGTVEDRLLAEQSVKSIFATLDETGKGVQKNQENNAQSKTKTIATTNRRNLDVLEPPRNAQTNSDKHCNRAENAVEPRRAAVLPGNPDVHAEQTADQVERDKNRRDDGDLLQGVVGGVALDDLIDGDLGEVVGVCAAEHLLEVGQVGHHGDDVVLDVAEVQADVAAGRDAVGFVAALGEALDDVGFAA
ncbi:hypothetical protein OPT61_g10459 [Boeremia exigua]|uniref:Uncharacterized protein n=1 Tax=Boeremia exigua TaxID=749465 RepID=A0ACC2HPS3_9PLEO|nr:hypothetical protein OPT61_g10459 [Boeremia exigua]